jgi:hypothetical protein
VIGIKAKYCKRTIEQRGEIMSYHHARLVVRVTVLGAKHCGKSSKLEFGS